MDIFHIDDNLKTYTYPMVKILICFLLILAFIYRDHIIQIDGKIINILIGVMCTVLGIICIYCIYISVFELFQVHENRTKTDNISAKAIAKGEMYSIDEIVSMAKNNDIIAIEIVSGGKRVEIGSSSDCKAGSSKFFDKLFYVDKKEFARVEDFQDAIQLYSDNGKITIISIDGVSPKRH